MNLQLVHGIRRTDGRGRSGPCLAKRIGTDRIAASRYFTALVHSKRLPILPFEP
jgi:hypothetical protein